MVAGDLGSPTPVQDQAAWRGRIGVATITVRLGSTMDPTMEEANPMVLKVASMAEAEVVFKVASMVEAEVFRISRLLFKGSNGRTMAMMVVMVIFMEGSKPVVRRLASTGISTPEPGEGSIMHTVTTIIQSVLEVEGTWGEELFGREISSTMVLPVPRRRSRRLQLLRLWCNNLLWCHNRGWSIRSSLPKSRWLNLVPNQEWRW